MCLICAAASSVARAVPVEPGIERRRAGGDGALVGGHRLGEVLGVRAVTGEDGVEQRLVLADARHAIHQHRQRHVHLRIGLERAERLLLERCGAPVPHKDLPPGGVDDGG
jgi:hypothetical protein